ncbi:MAG: hypothetical protein H6Q15_1874 [Bacteroidetes bacterium]|nr:hypothetical protein [Bacteroidota bacterium]
MNTKADIYNIPNLYSCGVVAQYSFQCKFDDLCSVINDLNQSSVTFEGCDFTFSKVSNDLSGGYLNKGIIFENCIFKSDLYISNIETENYFRFENCNFENNSCEINKITTSQTKWLYLSGISNINAFTVKKIKSETISTSCIDYELCLHDCTFSNFIISQIDNLKIYISGTTINNKLSIEKIRKTLFLHLDNFDNEHTINEIKISSVKDISQFDIFNNYYNSNYIINSINIEDCTFGTDFILRSFNESQEIKTLSLICRDTSFEEKVWIEGINTDKLSFINCKFLETTKIFDLKGELMGANFSNSTIEGLFLFNGWNSKIDLNKKAKINFSHVFLKSSGYIILRNFNFFEDPEKEEETDEKNNDEGESNGNFSFNFANILGNVIFQSSNINSLIANKANFLGHLLIQDISLNKLNLENSSGNITFNPKKGFVVNKNTIANRDTARIIKKCKENDGDKIKSLDYKSLEHSLFRDELNEKLKEQSKDSDKEKGERKPLERAEDTIIKLFSNVINKLNQDRILLLLNTCSNNNGTSWIKGVIFTIISCFVFFSIYIMAKDGMGNVFIWTDEKYIGDALSYFWLFGGLDILKNSNKDILISWYALIPYILGKIFIGYGIYQTISAFRKFGK